MDDTNSRTATPPVTAAPATDRPALWKHGVIAAVVAAIVTTAGAAIASAAGVKFSQGDSESIPIPMFTVLTLVFSLIGVGIAAILARKARRPRTAFVRTAIVLVVLSWIPDLAFGFDAASAVTLIVLHTVAALIVVPVVARQLPATR